MDGGFHYVPTQEDISGNEQAIKSGDITQAWVDNFHFALKYNTKGARAVYGARRNKIERMIEEPNSIQKAFMESNGDFSVNDISLGLKEIRFSIETQIKGLLLGEKI